MIEDTHVSERKRVESHVFNLSVRALITLIVVATVCFMSVYQIEVKEPLYTLVGMCIGYYFAQKEKPKSQQL
jgi:hypothetical protein